MGAERPTKEELLPLVIDMTDRQIASIYGVHPRTVATWRRNYDIKANGEYWEPVECENCRRTVSEYLNHGLCCACRKFYKRNGRHRTEDDMYCPGGKTGWCKRCKEKPAHGKGLCDACWWYQHNHGKPRPRHLIVRDCCKVCGRPYQSGAWGLGRCETCRRYFMEHGVERPERLWQNVRWCDCGHKATHFDVALSVLSADDYERSETYNLCDDCWQYLNEPVLTKGEATWQR